ncbi:MAG: PEGA domain-containing protein [bacterium]
MKKGSILIFLFFLFDLSLMAQEISELHIVGKGEYLQSEQIAKTIRDVNGTVCAGLIILSDLEGLNYESNNGIVKRNTAPGKDFLFLSPDERMVTVLKTGFKPLKIILNEYGIKLESGKTWQIQVTGTIKREEADKDLFDMVFHCSEGDVYSSYGEYAPILSKEKTISYKLPKGNYTFRFQKQGFADEVQSVNLTGLKEITITLKTGMMSTANRIKLLGIIRITSEPSGAEVLINGQKVGTTPYDNDLVAGNHQLELRKALYHPDISSFTLDEGKTVQIPRRLKPRFGYITVTSSPANSSVYIDGKPIGSTPLQRKELESARHTLRIESQLYHYLNQEIEIKDGEEVHITENLKPAFGSLEVLSTPESGAEVFIDGKRVGVTPYDTLQIASGKYLLKVQKQLFSDAEEQIVIADGQPLKRTIILNKYFGELQIGAPQSTIFVNGKQVGNGTYTERLAPGKYTVKADRGALYTPAEQDVFVRIGEKLEITLDPKPRLGYVTVFVEPKEGDDARIYIGDELKGNAPKMLDLLIGKYTITTKKNNFLDASQDVSLSEGEQKRLDFRLMTYEGSIQANRDRWGQAKWISAAATVLAGAAAVYFNSTSTTNHNNYLKATISDDAVKYRDLTKQNDLYVKISLGAAAVTAVSTIVSWIVQKSK